MPVDAAGAGEVHRAQPGRQRGEQLARLRRVEPPDFADLGRVRRPRRSAARALRASSRSSAETIIPPTTSNDESSSAAVNSPVVPAGGRRERVQRVFPARRPRARRSRRRLRWPSPAGPRPPRSLPRPGPPGARPSPRRRFRCRSRALACSPPCPILPRPGHRDCPAPTRGRPYAARHAEPCRAVCRPSRHPDREHRAPAAADPVDPRPGSTTSSRSSTPTSRSRAT